MSRSAWTGSTTRPVTITGTSTTWRMLADRCAYTPELERHVGHGRRLADERLGRAADHVEVVEQLQLVQPAADFLHLRVVEAAFQEVVAGNADADDEVLADALAHRFDDANAESQPVGQVAAVLVRRAG